MKFGIRTPSIRKSISARTTGKLKRSMKRKVIPGYGTSKSMLKVIHPVKTTKKRIYNKIYNKTTFSLFDIFKK